MLPAYIKIPSTASPSPQISIQVLFFLFLSGRVSSITLIFLKIPGKLSSRISHAVNV